MRTLNIFKGIRLMTFLFMMSLLAFSTQAKVVNGNSVSLDNEGGKKIHETEKQEIQLQDWMLNPNNFVVKEDSKAIFNMSSSTESENGINDWMLNSDNFKTSEEKEQDMIESWMLDPNHFKIIENEEQNRLEDWMLNPKYFKI